MRDVDLVNLCEIKDREFLKNILERGKVGRFKRAFGRFEKAYKRFREIVQDQAISDLFKEELNAIHLVHVLRNF